METVPAYPDVFMKTKKLFTAAICLSEAFRIKRTLEFERSFFMKRKWIALLLVAPMALTMSACGKTSDASTEESIVSAEESSVPAEESSTDAQESASSGTAESVEPENGDEIIITSGGYEIPLSALEHQTGAEDVPAVYFTNEITPESLMAIYEALGRTPTGNVAVKLHTGEGENSYNLEPDFIKDLVQTVDGTIVECNTAYGGSRANTALHMQVAEDRGYTAIADVDIMDADGGTEIPVTGGTRLETNQVGSHFTNYDFFVVLSHFKGHAQGGFGGALKNMSIGIASSEGKSLIHSGGTETTGFGWSTPAEVFTESMAEAAKSVYDYLGEGENLLYINVMNNVSVDCDCNANPAKPDMHDVGIFASLDPVALDQACVDFLYAVPDGGSVIERMQSRMGEHILEHAEEISFGSRKYHLVSIDE